jgi:hypothetical protein
MLYEKPNMSKKKPKQNQFDFRFLDFYFLFLELIEWLVGVMRVLVRCF